MAKKDIYEKEYARNRDINLEDSFFEATLKYLESKGALSYCSVSNFIENETKSFLSRQENVIRSKNKEFLERGHIYMTRTLQHEFKRKAHYIPFMVDVFCKSYIDNTIMNRSFKQSVACGNIPDIIGLNDLLESYNP